MISFETRGDLSKTQRFLASLSRGDFYRALEAAAQRGVAALSEATPKDSGETAGSWGFEIKRTRGSATITWTNSHIVNGAPIAIMLQYGHGTGTGGYVQGRDYINPAIKPIFDKIAEDVWKAVKSA